jgi:hypothetical protein
MTGGGEGFSGADVLSAVSTYLRGRRFAMSAITWTPMFRRVRSRTVCKRVSVPFRAGVDGPRYVGWFENTKGNTTKLSSACAVVASPQSPTPCGFRGAPAGANPIKVLSVKRQASSVISAYGELANLRS